MTYSEETKHEFEDAVRQDMETCYERTLYACLQSGKWTMTQAKNEALCAVKNFERDTVELNNLITELLEKSAAEERQEPTTGDE
jgi:uncharacterized protein YjhX (UPF0386 family)